MLKKALKPLLVTTALLSLSLGLVYLLTKDNIHAVIPGEVYRSAQLDDAKFSKLIEKYQLKSILNLRGAHPDKAWFKAEMKVSQAYGIKHYDLPMRAHKAPSAEQLTQLLHILKTAPRPLLIHCKAGADRTGLASALTLILNGAPLRQAKHQYAMTYWVLASDSVSKLFFPRYERWLKARGLEHSLNEFNRFISQRQALVLLP